MAQTTVHLVQGGSIYGIPRVFGAHTRVTYDTETFKVIEAVSFAPFVHPRVQGRDEPHFLTEEEAFQLRKQQADRKVHPWKYLPKGDEQYKEE